MLYGLKQILFKRMKSDMGVMAEHADNETELWKEIDNADNKILAEYAQTFLTTEDIVFLLDSMEVTQ